MRVVDRVFDLDLEDRPRRFVPAGERLGAADQSKSGQKALVQPVLAERAQRPCPSVPRLVPPSQKTRRLADERVEKRGIRRLAELVEEPPRLPELLERRGPASELAFGETALPGHLRAQRFVRRTALQLAGNGLPLIAGRRGTPTAIFGESGEEPCVPRGRIVAEQRR